MAWLTSKAWEFSLGCIWSSCHVSRRHIVGVSGVSIHSAGIHWVRGRGGNAVLSTVRVTLTALWVCVSQFKISTCRGDSNLLCFVTIFKGGHDCRAWWSTPLVLAVGVREGTLRQVSLLRQGGLPMIYKWCPEVVFKTWWIFISRENTEMKNSNCLYHCHFQERSGQPKAQSHLSRGTILGKDRFVQPETRMTELWYGG